MREHSGWSGGMADGVVTGRRGGGVSLLAGVLLVSLAGACDSTGPPASPSPISPSPTSSPPPTEAIRLSGRVTNEAGSPIADAIVEVDFGVGGGSGWLATRTNADGYYDFPRSGLYVYSFVEDDDYEMNLQMLPPASAGVVVQNLPMRRVRQINAGESTAVSVEPDSSRCSDLEDLFVLHKRCEVFRISAGTPGTLLVEARAAEAGGIVPDIFWYTSGNYAGPTVRSGPGAFSVPVSGGTYLILVGMPAEMATQRFEVFTSLR